MYYRLTATWKVLYHHTVEYESKVKKSGDRQQELPNIDKLILAIQQVLQDTDAQITPRSAAARVSAGRFYRPNCQFFSKQMGR